MRLTKSFRLLRFLNYQPILPVRALSAVLGWCAALIFTRSFVLAGHMAGLFWRATTLKQPMRMLAWYAARSPFRLEPLSDPVFDFTGGLSQPQRVAIIRFLDASQRTDIQVRLDQLTLIAGEVDPPMPGAVFDPILARFSDAAAAVFDHLATQTSVSPPPDTSPRDADFAVADAREALAAFAQTFPPADVPWYIISGTFLGLIREGGFLPHDYDIDLGINAEAADLDAIAARAMESADFALVANDDLRVLKRLEDGSIREDSLPILLKLVHRTGVHIDLFVHYLDGNLRWHGSHVHRWDNTEFALEDHVFEGTALRAPANPDLYLGENYGDWKTPVTDFSPSTGTPNLRVVHNLASLVLAIKRYALATAAADPRAERIIATLIDADYAVRTQAGIRLKLDQF